MAHRNCDSELLLQEIEKCVDILNSTINNVEYGEKGMLEVLNIIRTCSDLPEMNNYMNGRWEKNVDQMNDVLHFCYQYKEYLEQVINNIKTSLKPVQPPPLNLYLKNKNQI